MPNPQIIPVPSISRMDNANMGREILKDTAGGSPRRRGRNAKSESAKRCDDCGLPITTGVPECQTLFNLVLAEHFEKPAGHFGVHRLFVDVYCMQHPDSGCISFKSFAAHAMHLCWSLERGGSRALPSQRLRRWVERHPDWQKPVLPAQRGSLTIADVAYVSPTQHHEAVSRWAADVWSAYADLHSPVRHWLDLALAE